MGVEEPAQLMPQLTQRDVADLAGHEQTNADRRRNEAEGAADDHDNREMNVVDGKFLNSLWQFLCNWANFLCCK